MPTLSRAALLAVSLCAALPHLSVSQARVPAWTYTMNMTLDSGGTNKSSMAMRHQVSQGVLRQEFLQASGGQMPTQIEGMYMLLNDADSTMTTVMPAQHAAIVMPMGQLLSGKMGAMPKTSVRSSAPTVEDLGAGPRMLGHPTRHVRVTMSGSMDMTVGDHTCRRSLGGESEMWIADDAGLNSAMLAEAQHYLRLMDPSAMPDVTATSNKALLGGMPLKTVMRGTTANGQTVTTTMQVVELSHADLDASLFTVPADFKTTDMRKMMSALPPQLMDSIMTAQQTKQGSDCG